ncbi:RNA polymerase sigma-70 factor, ECF subfamily [Cyclobacterium lianum]|uniref:RNA polymerase sigma-70 factor, ECF subfamily n=1 Tax=Cyclobacterium lianum TaxID=388280 RepID=A0A1M7MK41_9BACT|nr:sigma-70 family RNA polymerase sigma factor [Cyclobacterium lianum]SHM91306.1 RNA polymerase sigma-70 factor, ECF subfamily [Cyclobacterium lianum]
MVPLIDVKLLEMISDPLTRDRGFRLLVETYQKRVYGMVRKMVIVHDDANDVVQNTFIKAFKNIHKFNHKSTLFTWIYRIAVNESLNFLEKKKRRNFFSMEDHHELMQAHIEESPLVDGNEIQKQLQKAILTLPEKQRLVFNLRYFEDLSYEDISAMTDTSVGSLKASYHHAVKKIEEILKQQ